MNPPDEERRTPKLPPDNRKVLSLYWVGGRTSGEALRVVDMRYNILDKLHEMGTLTKEENPFDFPDWGSNPSYCLSKENL